MARSIAASGDDAGSGPAPAATNPRREAANAPRAARSAGRRRATTSVSGGEASDES